MSIEQLINGPDGNLWFTEWGDPGLPVRRITPAGTVTPFPAPAGVKLYHLAAGPDGNLWFTEFYQPRVARIILAGVIDEFPLPSQTAYGLQIVAGPDGNIWLTQITPAALVRVTPAGAVAPKSR